MRVATERPLRAYEVVEKSTAFRRYIVFAQTVEQAKERVRLGHNQPHYCNYHEDGINPVITEARRMPELDDEATNG